MTAEENREEALGWNQCQEAVQRLTDYLSHELRPDEEAEVQRHLSQCKGCFARFHFEETLLGTIRMRAEQICAPGYLRAKILQLLPSNSGGNSGEKAPESNVTASLPPHA